MACSRSLSLHAGLPFQARLCLPAGLRVPATQSYVHSPPAGRGCVDGGVWDGCSARQCRHRACGATPQRLRSGAGVCHRCVLRSFIKAFPDIALWSVLPAPLSNSPTFSARPCAREAACQLCLGVFHCACPHPPPHPTPHTPPPAHAPSSTPPSPLQMRVMVTSGLAPPSRTCSTHWRRQSATPAPVPLTPQSFGAPWRCCAGRCSVQRATCNVPRSTPAAPASSFLFFFFFFSSSSSLLLLFFFSSSSVFCGGGWRFHWMLASARYPVQPRPGQGGASSVSVPHVLWTRS